ncbi:MAG TPA: AIPR family protein, partial [Nitrospirota bacterium]|nr:AIPR family protein [Nitrospirota bacterium]
NNGITIVCEECSYPPNTPSPLATLNNFQIVNGGQTTHALFEAAQENKDKIKSVLLLVRICESKKDYHITDKISETTNSQTPVRSRDLHANDRIQQKLEEQFKAIGYYYERKKNQHQSQAKAKRLDGELLGQICLAYYHDMPSEAKNQKAIVYGDKYNDVFKENEISAVKMLLPYRLFLPLEKMKKEIQRKKRNKEAINEKEAFISRAIFHLLNVCKLIVEKKHVNMAIDKNIDRVLKQAIAIVNKVVVKEAKKRGELYTHDKFFKEIQTNKIIREFALKQLEK